MSDANRLRKIYGNFNLVLSLFFLAICVSCFWLIAIFNDAFFGAILLIGIAMFFFYSVCFAQDAYCYFVDVRKEEIDKCDKAKLLRLLGLINLAWSFAFFSVCICCLWATFIFWKIIAFIVFVFLLCMFYLLLTKARNNFMEIKEVLED